MDAWRAEISCRGQAISRAPRCARSLRPGISAPHPDHHYLALALRVGFFSSRVAAFDCALGACFGLTLRAVVRGFALSLPSDFPATRAALASSKASACSREIVSGVMSE